MRKIFIFLIFIFFCLPVNANEQLDSDYDGIPDYDEINIYKTDPFNKDTDNDGFSDFLELNNGYSPHNPKPVKLENNDFDEDGLSDRLELNFGTDISVEDTDKDGYLDGEEIKNGFNPLNPLPEKLKKRIEININKQELSYYLGGVRLNKYPVSSGKNNSTPKGNFNIINKSLKAWSHYGLWMPYWLGLNGGRIGIHELPIWPNGYREGEDHLGIPVSHGCIRLGINSAKIIYNWAEIGTPVVIY